MPKTEETWMDEKKVIEAIKLINHCIDIQGKCKRITHANISAIDEDIKAYQVAIKALEKQLPKKPEKDGVTDSRGVFHPINGIDGVPYDLCPNCYSNLCTTGMFGRSKERMKYCEKCGQRLDWSE